MELSVRNATMGDAELIFRWRNAPEVRTVSKNSSIIDFSDHVRWMSNWLKNEKENFFWIYSTVEEDVGFVRFDKYEDDLYEISILTSNHKRRQGVGKQMLQDSLKRLAFQSQAQTIRAVAHHSNIASINLFLSVGFWKVSSSEEWVALNLHLQELS